MNCICAQVTPEQLDPYTLYVGNLPTKLNVTIFKEKFPTAKRIDIGYAQRTKFTRYAFLHYDNVDESMEAFKSTYNLTIDARSLVVRFRRNKGSVGLSEKVKRTKKVSFFSFSRRLNRFDDILLTFGFFRTKTSMVKAQPKTTAIKQSRPSYSTMMSTIKRMYLKRLKNYENLDVSYFR